MVLLFVFDGDPDGHPWGSKDDLKSAYKQLGVIARILLFVLILLATHLLCLLVIGRWLKLTLPELLTASNAAVLGATTAPAMAAAKGWHDQVTPGVLVGVLGYALGTLIGSLLFNLV